MSRSAILTYFKVMRLYSIPAPLAPVLICWALVHRATPHVPALDFLLLLTGVCALFFAANLVNEYYDFKKGVDTAESAGTSGVLVHGLLPPSRVRAFYIWLYGAACAIGLYFIWLRGLPLLLLLCAGICGGYLYTGGPRPFKYHGLGEPLVFCLMGPLLFAALQYALAGAFSLDNFLLSIPFGLLCTSVLTANNLRDHAVDAGAGIRTIATMLGFPAARVVFTLLVALPFFFIALFVWCKMFSSSLLLSLIALPAAVLVIAPVWSRDPLQHMKHLVQKAFGMQLLFSLLTFIAIVW